MSDRRHPDKSPVHNSVNDTVRESVKFDTPKTFSDNSIPLGILLYLVKLCFETVNKIIGNIGSGLSNIIIKGSLDVAFGSRT